MTERDPDATPSFPDDKRPISNQRIPVMNMNTDEHDGDDNHSVLPLRRQQSLPGSVKTERPDDESKE